MTASNTKQLIKRGSFASVNVLKVEIAVFGISFYGLVAAFIGHQIPVHRTYIPILRNTAMTSSSIQPIGEENTHLVSLKPSIEEHVVSPTPSNTPLPVIPVSSIHNILKKTFSAYQVTMHIPSSYIVNGAYANTYKSADDQIMIKRHVTNEYAYPYFASSFHAMNRVSIGDTMTIPYVDGGWLAEETKVASGVIASGQEYELYTATYTNTSAPTAEAVILLPDSVVQVEMSFYDKKGIALFEQMMPSMTVN